MSAITTAIHRVLPRVATTTAMPAAAAQVTRSFGTNVPSNNSTTNRVIWTQHSFLTFDPETQAILTSAFEKKKSGEGLKTAKRTVSNPAKLPSVLVNTLFASAAAQNAGQMGAGIRGYSTLRKSAVHRDSAQVQRKSSSKNTFVARHAFLAMDDTQQFLREQAELERLESAKRQQLSAACAQALRSAK